MFGIITMDKRAFNECEYNFAKQILMENSQHFIKRVKCVFSAYNVTEKVIYLFRIQFPTDITSNCG